jgi:hypothetical protein
MDRIKDWLRDAEAWLDARGKPAWIVAMVLGFVFFWPLGLAILFYMIWSKRMMSCKHGRWRHRHGALAPSGNSAFDEYKAETLKRLEEEQGAFTSFLDRLRRSKDKAEFDMFVSERKSGRDMPDAEPVV